MLFGGHMLLMVLTNKKLLECLTQTNCKENQKEFRTKKVIKEMKEMNYVLNEKDTVIPLIAGLTKKDIV